MTRSTPAQDKPQSHHLPTTCPSVQALEFELAFLVRRLEAARRRFDFGLEPAACSVERAEMLTGSLACRGKK